MGNYLSGLRVARELDCLVAERGKPKMIVSDNGSEFTSNAILGWADRTRVEWHDIAPGKPMQNGFIESFNGRLRDALLSETVLILARCSGEPDQMAARLQWQPTAFATRLADTKRVCINLHTTTGIGAAQYRKLHATARRINRLSRQNQCRKRTPSRIKPGGKVTSRLHSSGRTPTSACGQSRARVEPCPKPAGRKLPA